MTMSGTDQDTEGTVLAVLAGTPLVHAATESSMDPADLNEVVERYRAAGRAALDAHPSVHDEWHQVRIQFSDWNAAEHLAGNYLAPRLHQAQMSGALTDWWFMRKFPCWRLRCRPGATTTRTAMRDVLDPILDELVASGGAERWWASIYESETHAFGGPRGMDVAHSLFAADSRNILDYLRHPEPTTSTASTVGRRELSVLLCSALFRGARLDSYEQGDVWHRVTQIRPLPDDTPTARLGSMIGNIQHLTRLDTAPGSALFDNEPLAFARDWTDAFTAAGRELADAARDGVMERGLRHILVHHVIFAWNRLGLPARTQAILAHACRDALLP